MIHLVETTKGKADPVSEITAFLEELTKPTSQNLLLYVHGGLISDEAGRAELAALEAEWGVSLDDWVRAYLIWRSGLWETIKNDWEEILGDVIFKALLSAAIEWIEGPLKESLLETAGEGASFMRGSTDAAYLDDLQMHDAEILSAVSTAFSSGDATRTFLDKLRAQQDLQTLMADLATNRGPVGAGDASRAQASLALLRRETRDALLGLALNPRSFQTRGDDLDKWLLQVACEALGGIPGRILFRFLIGRDHGKTTVIEEVLREYDFALIGGAIWTAMKDDLKAHFRPGGAGLQLLDTLASLEPGKRPRVLIVAHSAGALFAAEFAANCASRNLDLDLDVILWAPAIRIDGDAKDLLATGARDGRIRPVIRSFRMFGLSDGYEKTDKIDNTPVISEFYQRSLLYLVSALLESGGALGDAMLLGMQRHLEILPDDDLYTNEQSARDLIRGWLGPSQLHRTIWSSQVVGPPGQSCTAKTHGGFYVDFQTVTSAVFLALNGFGPANEGE